MILFQKKELIHVSVSLKNIGIYSLFNFLKKLKNNQFQKSFFFVTSFLKPLIYIYIYICSYLDGYDLNDFDMYVTSNLSTAYLIGMFFCTNIVDFYALIVGQSLGTCLNEHKTYYPKRYGVTKGVRRSYIIIILQS